VLGELDRPLREFLAGSCVLPVLDAGTCDTVLERTDSAAMLAELERRGVVAPEGGAAERPRYRVPMVVHEALCGELEQRVGKAQARRAYGRAGDVLERAGEWWPALWSFSRAGDAEAVARLSGARPAVDGGSAGRADAAAGPMLTVRLLGTFEVEGDGAQVDLSPLRPRVRSVLQYLALHADAYVHRDVLAAVLWPESDLETGRRGVQVAVSALRSLLQPGQPRQSTLLPRRGDAYALALAGHGSSDVVELDAQLVRARRARAIGDTGTAVAAWREVARLYRGELLLEQGNAEWVVAERDRLRLAAADALDSLGTHLVEADDLVETDAVVEGVAALRRALELDPFRDGTWRTLAETHETFGDRSAAAAVRRRHRRVLEDLGVLDEPAPRTEPRPEPLGAWTGPRLK
ncbi:MAG TPA: winged helix-turn-helix domain-containing protein, partial [Kineosporiaceae bacterium]|nr:winged helix-turn-helix domain-containing protein [Kineosporiaceae bacterium]